jgi:hypothetical protein
MPDHENGSSNHRSSHPALAAHGGSKHAPSDKVVRRLARGPECQAIATEDDNGILRYMYADGSIDERSTLDIRNPYNVVKRLAVAVVLKDEPEHAGDTEDRLIVVEGAEGTPHYINEDGSPEAGIRVYEGKSSPYVKVAGFAINVTAQSPDNHSASGSPDLMPAGQASILQAQ